MTRSSPGLPPSLTINLSHPTQPHTLHLPVKTSILLDQPTLPHSSNPLIRTTARPPKSLPTRSSIYPRQQLCHICAFLTLIYHLSHYPTPRIFRKRLGIHSNCRLPPDHYIYSLVYRLLRVHIVTTIRHGPERAYTYHLDPTQGISSRTAWPGLLLPA